MLKASVIVSTYNVPKYLKLVLDALKDQDIKTFEVIIADDGSIHETRDLINNLVSTFPVPLRHVWHENTGFRAATIRNKAVAIAKGDYLIFLDGDCIPLTSFIRHHLKIAEKNWFVTGKRSFANKEFTEQLLTGKVINIHKFTIWQWFCLCSKHYCNRFFSFIYLPVTKVRKLRPKKWVGAQTCNLGIWRSDFLTINGFDENYQGWGYEDSDLAIRLIKNGTLRKSGDYAVPVIHLWHEQNDRSNEPGNLELLNNVLQNNRIKAEIGINQYI